MGGDTAGPVPRDGHEVAFWEKRVDALLVLCTTKGHFTVDGLRRVLEDMDPASFETMSYYERWVKSVSLNMIERGLLTQSELAARMDEVAARGASYAAASGPAPERHD